MNKNNHDERKLCIMDCVWNLLLHWRKLLISIVGFAIIFGGVKYLKDYSSFQSKSVSQVTDNSTLEQIEDNINNLKGPDKADAKVAINLVRSLISKQEYATNACAMKLDCYNVDRYVIQYYIDAKENCSELLQAYSNSFLSDQSMKQIVDASDNSMSKDDIVDMITTKNGGANFQISNVNKTTVASGDENAVLYVTVRGIDKETALKVAEVVKNIISSYNSRIKEIYGDHSIEIVSENYMSGRDEDVVNLQTAAFESSYDMNDKLDTLTSKMSEQAAQLVKQYEEVYNLDQTNETSDNITTEESIEENSNISLNKKWIVFGALFGGVLTFGLEFLYWLFGGYLNSSNEIQNNFSVHTFGIINDNKKHKYLWRIDKILYKIKNRNIKVLNKKQMFNMILSNIVLSANRSGISKIYITGTTFDSIRTFQFFDDLKEKAKQHEIELVLGHNIICDSVAFTEMAEVGNAIIVEETHVSKYQDIEREMTLLEEQSINILGSIIVER